jgi:hypothetical protein
VYSTLSIKTLTILHPSAARLWVLVQIVEEVNNQPKGRDEVPVHRQDVEVKFISIHSISPEVTNRRFNRRRSGVGRIHSRFGRQVVTEDSSMFEVMNKIRNNNVNKNVENNNTTNYNMHKMKRSHEIEVIVEYRVHNVKLKKSVLHDLEEGKHKKNTVKNVKIGKNKRTGINDIHHDVRTIDGSVSKDESTTGNNVQSGVQRERV